MSLLTPPTINPAQRLAGEVNRIKSAPRRLTEVMVREWQQGFNLMWTTANGITPADRLAAIGTDAAELFAANAALVTFLVAQLTGKDDALVTAITTAMATIPAHTVNPDGTITLD